MHYIVLDLEWNQPMEKQSAVIMPDQRPFMNEVIQIGAVRLDEDLQICDDLLLSISPKYYKRLHYRVRELTGLTTKALKNGVPFPEAMETFQNWCGKNCLFFTWSNMDMPILLENMRLYGLPTDRIPPWYDMQLLFNAQTDTGNTQKSLAAAAQHLGIEIEAPLHDARNDAIFAASILSRLDVPQGIRAYYKKTPLLPRQLRRGPGGRVALLGYRYFGHATLEQMLREPMIYQTACPLCDDPLNSQPWAARKREFTYFTLASCPTHGTFYFRLQLVNTARTQWEATLSVFEADDACIAQYQRLSSALPKKRRKKKTTVPAIDV